MKCGGERTRIRTINITPTASTNGSRESTWVKKKGLLFEKGGMRFYRLQMRLHRPPAIPLFFQRFPHPLFPGFNARAVRLHFKIAPDNRVPVAEPFTETIIKKSSHLRVGQ